MNLNTLFHQSTSPWCFINKERQVELKLRTDFDVKSVTCIYGDPHDFKKVGAMYVWQYQEVPMIQSTDGISLYWNVTLKPPQNRLKYCFKIHSDSVVYYGPKRFAHQLEHDLWNYFFVPYVHQSKTFVAPEWVTDTVWYQIFPDRFHAVPKVRNWTRGSVNNLTHYGGNLKGIQEKLPYLQKMGITGLYLTPIFLAPSAHKYDSTDYTTIDPHFGSTQDLIDLVQRAHTLNIKVMLDAVFNHSGTAFQAWKDAQDPNHPHHAWYHWTDQGYETFSFVKNMPKLNTEHPEVIDYFCKLGQYWIEVADIDGWRLDVANEISDVFLRRFREAVKAIKPDVYVLGELWHNGLPWLNGDMFDGVMNYHFTDSIQRFCIEQSSTKEQFMTEYLHYLNTTPLSLLAYQFNLLDSHDTARLMSRAQQDIHRVKQALALMFFSAGTPCIYYGTEIAMKGQMDPDCRRLMQFSPDPEKSELYHFIQTWIGFRKQLSCINSVSDFAFIKHSSLLILRRNTHVLIINHSQEKHSITDYGECLYISNASETLDPQHFALCVL